MWLDPDSPGCIYDTVDCTDCGGCGADPTPLAAYLAQTDQDNDSSES